MDKFLSGKVALVTGGARGIGAATVSVLAAAGAQVAFTYRSSAAKAFAVVEEIKSAGGEAVCLQSDQGDVNAAEALIDSVLRQFGRLDILVNNAAGFISVKVDDRAIDLAALDRLYAVNLLGVIATIRAAARVMLTGGRIISLSSNVAHRAGYTGFADYIATKAGLAGYCKGAARDLGPRGITVNVLQCGPTATEMNPDNTELAAALKGSSALARYGQPDEIAAAILFLASPQASFVTGITLPVDGGIDA